MDNFTCRHDKVDILTNEACPRPDVINLSMLSNSVEKTSRQKNLCNDDVRLEMFSALLGAEASSSDLCVILDTPPTNTKTEPDAALLLQ